MNKLEEYRSLVVGYGSGLYTSDEVVSKSLGLLYESDDREALWEAFAPAHREKMSLWLSRFDESAEPFAIKADPFQLWREMSDLKRWLAARGR